MEPVCLTIETEDPRQHWQFMHLQGKRVLNLGCGHFGQSAINQYPDEIEYFFEHSPELLVGVDKNAKDIAFLQQKHHTKIQDDRLVLLAEECATVPALQKLIDTYNINTIKSDIEGFEFLFEWLPDEDALKIQSWYIEVHGNNLIRSIKAWADRLNLHLTAQIHLKHGTNYPCLVYCFERVL